MTAGTFTPRFDDALNALASEAIQAFGGAAIEDGSVRFLRDASGIITTLLKRDFPPEVIINYEQSLEKFASYIDNKVELLSDETFDKSILDDARYTRLTLRVEDESHLHPLILDRRIIGADWVSLPPELSALPIYTFASLKGGVGRSTALTLVAADLAASGYRVLALDFDLEAPGLGSFLLPREYRPKYGILDYFVEKGASKFDGLDFADIMEASPVITGGAPAYVAPAFGQMSLAHPENVLGKISRAYVEDYDEILGIRTFADRARDLVNGLSQIRDFDVVLVDSRAGLHETSAAALLGLGAEVLLFGTYQDQTFEGYAPLLSHLNTFTPHGERVEAKLRMVHGKADLSSPDELAGFRDASHRLFSENIYDEPEQTAEQFEVGELNWFNVNDPDGPHFPWVVGDSSAHRLFDPIRNPAQLSSSQYSEAFGDLIGNVRADLGAKIGYDDGLG